MEHDYVEKFTLTKHMTTKFLFSSFIKYWHLLHQEGLLEADTKAFTQL